MEEFQKNRLHRGKPMIRQCRNHEVEAIYSIINDAAQAYKGIIPADRWKEPPSCCFRRR